MPAETLEMPLRQFCLTTMASQCAEMIASAEAQNWGYRKLLLQLCEAEAADRRERRRQRLLRDSKLPSGKTLGNLEEGKLPAKVRRQLPSLLEGGFIERAENLLVFGLPGRGKTHFLCALGRELILRHGLRICFTPTFKLVQQLLSAKKDLRLDPLLKKLDGFDGIILDSCEVVNNVKWRWRSSPLEPVWPVTHFTLLTGLSSFPVASGNECIITFKPVPSSSRTAVPVS
jgi:DNA replication protein DnaC